MHAVRPVWRARGVRREGPHDGVQGVQVLSEAAPVMAARAQIAPVCSTRGKTAGLCVRMSLGAATGAAVGMLVVTDRETLLAILGSAVE